MNKYMITLVGIDDMEVAFVDEDLWKWIQMETDFPEGYALGDLEEYGEVDMNPTTGSSPDNDRALLAMCLPDVPSCWSVVEAAEIMQRENYEIVGEYEGAIY
jgi:hypothetical protein